MAEIRHLTRAPISEALLDLRVAPRDGFRVEGFNRLRTELSARFPQVKELRSMRATFEVEGGGRIAQGIEDTGPQGLLLKSEDGRTIAQFRADGFTYNRLAPYTSWDELLPDALELWAQYRDIAGPSLLTRVAVRYINHLTFAFPIDDFTQYLTVPPELPPGAPKFLSSFLTRLVIEDLEQGITTNFVQALEPGVDASAISVLIDIDAYKTQEQGFSDDQVRPTFEALRALKNRIFFGSITEETARRYD